MKGGDKGDEKAEFRANFVTFFLVIFLYNRDKREDFNRSFGDLAFLTKEGDEIVAITKDDQRLEVISQCLNYMCSQVSIENSIRRYDINISMENFYAGVLSIILGCNLINCNLFGKNAESIDLSDKNAYIAVQVTSSDRTDKIKNTIDTFNKNAYYTEYDKLYIYIITAKIKHKKKYDLGNDVELIIWDASDVMAVVAGMPLKRQKRLYEYFKEKIPQVVTLFENGSPIPVKCEMQFKRTEMAFWMNPYAADDEQWFDDHYQIALADYLITMEKRGLYLLVDFFERDLAYTLNCHAKELGVAQQWTEQGSAAGGKIVYFDPKDAASVSKIVEEVTEWRDSKKSYQLLINFSAAKCPQIFRMVMRAAREIIEKCPCIVPEILSLVNPYELDFGPDNPLDVMDKLKSQALSDRREYMGNHISWVYRLLHECDCSFSSLVKVWANGTDKEKLDLLEFASYSRTAVRKVRGLLTEDGLERLLSDDLHMYWNIRWDEIILYIVQNNEGNDWADPILLERILQKGSDECREFLQTKQAVTREDWNELICEISSKDYEQYVERVQYLNQPEYLKLLYGCAYGEKERAKVIANQQLLDSYREMLGRKDWDTEYLFPDFMRGAKL